MRIIVAWADGQLWQLLVGHLVLGSGGCVVIVTGVIPAWGGGTVVIGCDVNVGC